MSLLLGAFGAALTALPRLAAAAARLRRARALRAAPPLPVGGLTDAAAREAEYALQHGASTLEARAPRSDAKRRAQRACANKN